MRFHATRKLERHDGLQVDLPGLGKPFGFAIERLRVRKWDWLRPTRAKPDAGDDGPVPVPIFSQTLRHVRQGSKSRPMDVFEAAAGLFVEVELPHDHPEIPLERLSIAHRHRT